MITRFSNYERFRQTVLKRAFDKVVDNYLQTNDSVFNDDRFWLGDWGITHRSNGQVVFGNVRNIVDTGNLRDSRQITYSNPLSVSLSWGTGIDYASKVFYGQARDSSGWIPGRDWVSETNTQYKTIF